MSDVERRDAVGDPSPIADAVRRAIEEREAAAPPVPRRHVVVTPGRPAGALHLPEPGQALVLLPGEELQAQASLRRPRGARIVLTANELILTNGRRHHRFAIPGMASRRRRRPVVRRLVSVFVHRRLIGALHKGHKFVYAIGESGRLLGTVDVSGTWSFSEDGLSQICALAGIDHSVEIFDTPRELVAAHAEWAGPRLEFELNHPREEATREWAQFIALAVPLAVILGGVATAAFFASPVGRWVGYGVVAAGVLELVLTRWAASRWRARRSLQRQAGRGGIPVDSTGRPGRQAPPTG